MDLYLGGKTAIMTGGSKGIGAGVARGLAAEGCAVHIVSRTLVELEKLLLGFPRILASP